MIYIYAHIYNFPQLLKIKYNETKEIQKNLKDIALNYKCQFFHAGEHENLFEYSIGNELDCSPSRISEVTFKIFDTLKQNSNKLNGFNILILIHDKTDTENKLNKLKKIIYSVNGEETIWTTRNEIPYLTDLFIFEQIGDLFRVSKKSDYQKTINGRIENTWIRKSTYNKIFDAITPILNGEENSKILFLCGEKGSGKTTTTNIILKDLIDPKYLANIPIMYIRFSKHSFIHPFLNSITTSFIESAGKYLKPIDLTIWNEKSDLLLNLKNGGYNEKYPDKLFEDFLIGYSLYIKAYIQMMIDDYFPGILICDDIDEYTIQAKHLLTILLSDFLNLPSFIPILISKKDSLPAEFNNLPFKKVKINLLQQDEILSIVDAFFPGLSVSKELIDKLTIFSKSKINPIITYLNYAFLSGKIKKSGIKYIWTNNKEYFLSSNESNSFFYLSVIKTLNQNEKDILYYIYISSGLFTRKDLLIFLESGSIKKPVAEKTIFLLSKYGFVIPGEYIIPCFPILKNQIEEEESMKSRCNYLRETLCNYVIKLWEQKKIFKYVLLYSFFITNREYSLAIKLLYCLIKRKIDEKDYDSAKSFLLSKNIQFQKQIKNGDDKIKLKIVIFSGKLRIALLEGKKDDANKIIQSIATLEINKLKSSIERGDLYLHMAKYYRLQGEKDKSIKSIKNALLDFQNINLPEGLSLSYIELGAVLLNEYKINDVLEYLKFAERLLPENTYLYGKIQILINMSITLFIQGNISKSISTALDAKKIAKSAATINWKIFICLLIGRGYFELGKYNESETNILEGISLSTIYSIKSAKSILFSWLARVKIYSGRIKEGIIILNSLMPNTESQFFLAEANYFQKKYEVALNLLEMSLKIKPEIPWISDETIYWKDGFSQIEGRIINQGNNDSILINHIKTFRAYLLGLNSMLKESISEFYEITRTLKSNFIDSHIILHYFLYSLILQNSKEAELDDSITILNKALKQMQERAARIENPQDRTEYLFKNYWNNFIFSEAKKKNLIY